MRGWNGHLVALSSGYLIDLSIDQLNRPARQIALSEPLLIRVDPSTVLDGYEFLVPVGRNLVVYEPRRDCRTFMVSKDWMPRYGVVAQPQKEIVKWALRDLERSRPSRIPS